MKKIIIFSLCFFVVLTAEANLVLEKQYHGAGVYSLNAIDTSAVKIIWKIDCDTTGQNLEPAVVGVFWPYRQNEYKTSNIVSRYTRVKTYGPRTYFLGIPGTYTATAVYLDGSTESASYVSTPDDIPEWGTGPFVVFRQFMFLSDTSFCDEPVLVYPQTEMLGYARDTLFEEYQVLIDGTPFDFWGDKIYLLPGTHIMQTSFVYKGEKVVLVDTVEIYAHETLFELDLAEFDYVDSSGALPALRATPISPSTDYRQYQYDWDYYSPVTQEFVNLYTNWSPIDTTGAFSQILLGPAGYYHITLRDGTWCSETFIYEYMGSSAIGQSGDQREYILIFPNPATTEIKIESSADGIGVIYDQNGRTVENFKPTGGNQTRVDLSNIPSGNYTVVLYPEVGPPIAKKLSVVK